MLIEVEISTFVLDQWNVLELSFAFRPNFSCHDPLYVSVGGELEPAGRGRQITGMSNPALRDGTLVQYPYAPFFVTYSPSLMDRLISS